MPGTAPCECGHDFEDHNTLDQDGNLDCTRCSCRSYWPYVEQPQIIFD